MTVAFFHIKLANDLPGIGYTVTLDYVFYTLYVLIISDLVITVIMRQEHQKENHVLVRRLAIFGRIFYPVALVAVFFILTYVK